MPLTGRVALVTGGGRGIGKGCALELARAGADVIVNDRPGSPDLKATADEIRELGHACTPLEADVFSRAGCEDRRFLPFPNGDLNMIFVFRRDTPCVRMGMHYCRFERRTESMDQWASKSCLPI